MPSHKYQTEKHNNYPQPASSGLTNAAEYVTGLCHHKGSLLTQIHRVIHIDILVLFYKAAF